MMLPHHKTQTTNFLPPLPLFLSLQVTKLAPKLKKIQASVDEIKHFVVGGVDSQKMKSLLGDANVKVIKGLSNFSEDVVSEGKVVVVEIERE